MDYDENMKVARIHPQSAGDSKHESNCDKSSGLRMFKLISSGFKPI